MEEIMTKTKMLKNIECERLALDSLLKQLSPEAMLEPGLESGWSVKDVLAHILAWEELMLGWTEETLRGDTPNRPAPGTSWDDLDEFNERLFLENKDRTLEEVLEGFHASYPRLCENLLSVSEEDLLEPDRFEWRNGDPLWHMVAGNTWWHYKEHRESIEKWLSAGS